MTQIIAKNKTEEVAVNFTNPTQGLEVMDEHSPSIKVIIKGQEVLGSIVDGGSRVNVINKLTYDKLDIKWEPVHSIKYQCIMDVFTLSSLSAQVRAICIISIKGSCPK